MNAVCVDVSHVAASDSNFLMSLPADSGAKSPVCASMRKKERADGYGQPGVFLRHNPLFLAHHIGLAPLLGQQVRQEAAWCAWRAQEHTRCLRKNCTQNGFRMAKQGRSLSEQCAVNFRSYAHSFKDCAAHTLPWRLDLFIGVLRAESILARSLIAYQKNCTRICVVHKRIRRNKVLV